MITIHEAKAADFATLGLGALLPSECTVRERAGGMYELKIVHPITDDGRHHRIKPMRIIKAPAPVRETPLVEIDQTGTIYRSIYKVVTDGRRLYLRVKPDQESKGLHAYKPGTEVAALDLSSDGKWRRVAILDGGATGWMWAGNLEFVRTETETIVGDTPGGVVQPRQTREQLFRIYRYSPDTKERAVTAEARHITYDLAGAVVDGEYSPENVPANQVCAQIMARADHDVSDFHIYCTITDPISGEYGGRNILDCLLDPETGIVAQTKARIVRDNYDIFILPDEVRSRGVELRYGKNLLSAYMDTDTSNTITRIKPVGKDKDGEPLYVEDNGGWVESPYINDYPVVYSKEVEYDVVESDDLPINQARALLKEKAEADFIAGCDMATVRLDADFVRLELTEEYKHLANQYALHLYDSVPVIDRETDIVATARMTEYVYDAVLDQYQDTGLGELDEVKSTIYGYELASGTVSGGKLIPNTVNGDRLQNLSVSYGKFDLAAIKHLSADAITAIRADIRELVAGNITADQLYADLATIAAAQITAANIEKANIQWAQIENLSAEIARVAEAEIKNAKIDYAQINNLNAGVANIVEAEIKNANIDVAQIENLTAEIAKITAATIEKAKINWAQIVDVKIGTADIEDATITTAKIALGAITSALIKAGAIGTAQIADGSITEAKIVSLNADVIKSGTLSTDRLLIKGTGGLFYEINATAGGLTSTQLTQEQYKNAISGTALVARSVTADKIAAKSITANEILSGTITAAEINVANLFAADATIAALNNYILRTQTIEAIEGKLDVWASEKIKLAVDDVQVGGRNLLRNTATLKKANYSFNNSSDASAGIGLGSTTEDEYGGFRVVCKNQNVRIEMGTFPVTPGQTYVMSVQYKINSGSAPIQFQYVFRNAAGTGLHYWDSVNHSEVGRRVEDGWTVMSSVFTVPDNAAVTIMKLAIRTGKDNTAYTCDYNIRRPQLETGNKATDWSPAPEDTDESISKLSAELSIQAGEIAARVTKTEFDSLGNEVSRQGSEISATPNRIKAAVESVKIGGTNLVRCGDGTITIASGGIERNWDKSAFCQSGVGIIFRPFSSTYNGAHFYTDVTVAPGEYTLSFWCWTHGIDVQPTLRCNLWGKGNGIDHYFKDIQSPAETPTRYEIPITVTYTSTVNLRLLTWTKFTTGEMYVSDVKLEKGTKATDWSPSPEDVEGEIEAVRSAVLEITPEYILQEVRNSKEYQQDIASVKITDDKIVSTVRTSKLYQDDLGSKANADDLENLDEAVGTWIEQTDKDILLLAGRTVGGTNLLRNTETLKKANYSFNSSGSSAMGSCTEDEYGGFHIVCSNSNLRWQVTELPVTPGQSYVMSVQYKINSGSAPIQFQYVFRDAAGTGLIYWDSVNHSQVGRKVEDGWTVMTSVFTVPDNAQIVELRLAVRTGADYGTYTVDYNIRRPKFEAGSMPTDWTPSPDDPAGSVRAGSSVLITEDKIKLAAPETEIAIPDTDGERTVAKFDADGLTAERVQAGNVSYRYDGPAALYVNPNATSAQIAAGNYFKSLTDACVYLSYKILYGSVSITVQGDSYGVAELHCIGGGGRIDINGGGHKLIGSLYLYDCAPRVHVNSLTVSRPSNGAKTYAGAVTNCNFIAMNSVVLDGNGGTYALIIEYGARLWMENVELYNATHLLYAVYGTDVTSRGLRGGGGTNFAWANGCILKMEGTRPDGEFVRSNAAMTYPDDPNALPIDYGTAQPSVPVISTASWSYLYSDSYAGAWGKPGTDAAQGVIRTDSSGTTAAIYGTIWFDAAAIRSALSGKTIRQVSLRLTMLKGYGRDTTVSVQLYGTNTAYSGRSGQPQLVTSYGTIGTTEPGAVSEITIPTTVISDIVNGTIQALVLKSDDSELYKDRDYSKNYARFAGSATADGSTCPRLTVVYQ